MKAILYALIDSQMYVAAAAAAAATGILRAHSICMAHPSRDMKPVESEKAHQVSENILFNFSIKNSNSNSNRTPSICYARCNARLFAKRIRQKY